MPGAGCAIPPPTRTGDATGTRDRDAWSGNPSSLARSARVINIADAGTGLADYYIAWGRDTHVDATLPRPHTRPGSRLCQRANVAFATNEGSKLGSQRRALRVVEEQSVLIDRTARQKPLKAAFADVAADKR